MFVREQLSYMTQASHIPLPFQQRHHHPVTGHHQHSTSRWPKTLQGGPTQARAAAGLATSSRVGLALTGSRAPSRAHYLLTNYKSLLPWYPGCSVWSRPWWRGEDKATYATNYWCWAGRTGMLGLPTVGMGSVLVSCSPLHVRATGARLDTRGNGEEYTVHTTKLE